MTHSSWHFNVNREIVWFWKIWHWRREIEGYGPCADSWETFRLTHGVPVLLLFHVLWDFFKYINFVKENKKQILQDCSAYLCNLQARLFCITTLCNFIKSAYMDTAIPDYSHVLVPMQIIYCISHLLTSEISVAVAKGRKYSIPPLFPLLKYPVHQSYY